VVVAAAVADVIAVAGVVDVVAFEPPDDEHAAVSKPPTTTGRHLDHGDLSVRRPC